MRWSYNLERSQAVAVWLFAIAALIVAMVIVGGATRLTGSGLSITEWAPVTGALVSAPGSGVQAAADFENALSPETYIGYGRAANFASPGGQKHNQTATYDVPKTYGADGWGLAGSWKVGAEMATSMAPGARIQFSFHARDLHMVLGPAANGKPVRFRITLNGKPPGADHGLDVDANGVGTITSQRLYQLVRQQRVSKDPLANLVFQIEFLDPGAQAFTFTFG